MSVIVIEQFVSMCLQFRSHYRFIHCPQIYAFHVIQHCTNIIVVEDSCKYPDVIQVQLQQIFSAGFYQREDRC